MKSEQYQISGQLRLEWAYSGWPILWIAREGNGRVRIELSEVQYLAHILHNVAADLAGYPVGDHVPVTSEEGANGWRRLVGQTVQVPGGDLGTVMGPVGDWSQPHSAGCVLVSFADRRPQVFHLDEIEAPAQAIRSALHAKPQIH